MKLATSLIWVGPWAYQWGKQLCAAPFLHAPALLASIGLGQKYFRQK
jgi:hypothetical protein